MAPPPSVEKRENIIRWLGPSGEAVQEDIARGRDPQISQWLLDRTEFLSWMTSDDSANFWLWGIRKLLYLSNILSN
jgi:hypothetical protein